MKRSGSITAKLILAFLAVSVTVLALASGITYWLTVREFKQLVFNQSRDQFVSDVGLYYQMNGSWEGVQEYVNLRNTSPQPGVPGPGVGQPPVNPNGGQNLPSSITFLLADVTGKVLVPAGQFQVGQTLPSATLEQGTAVDVSRKQVGTVLVIGSPPPLGGLELQYLNRTNMALLYAALGAALVSLGLGTILARTLTHPLRKLTAAIHAMAKGDLKQHVQVNSSDELSELATAFNQMSADLDRLNISRRQMTADIAHDLRSPLTVIGGYVESIRDGVLKPTPERLDTIHAEVMHLQRLVEDLRTLSQADAGELRLHREPMAPLALLEQIAKSYNQMAAQNKVTLEVQAQPDLPVIRLDQDRMAQVFGNLIGNSLRYTPQGGRILLTAGQEKDMLIFHVQDNGQGISPEVLPYIFDRFYRADSARSQGGESGLGLAIARSVVEAHGGSISAESAVGQGTKIKMVFPLP
ncbi:MAG: ATP-binding protein [Anaerolineales bacterium]|jgi:signal transduction histidine kinase